MVNDLGRHTRITRRMKHLMRTLRQTRVHSVRMKVMEELRHEFERTGLARLPAWLRVNARRGAIGTADWGKRTGRATARRTRAAGRFLGAYAREQAAERNKTRPQRQKAKLARRQARDAARLNRNKQRATRRAQRAKSRTAASGSPLTVRMRLARLQRLGGFGFVRANKVAPRQRAATAPDAPKTRAPRSKPAARTTANPLPKERPARKPRITPVVADTTTRAPRAPRAPRSGTGTNTG